MFDLSSQYAIRAMIYLAQLEPGRLVQAHIMAKELTLPAPYLSKILQQMVKDGLTVSRKGPSGGFALARKPSEIRLYDLLESFQKMHRVESCILGDATCSDEDPCALHAFWNEVRQSFINTMRSMSLADLVEHEKRRAAARPATSTAAASRNPSASREMGA
jgi:Rrf2 family iron-sulfur cluster assembly transcriptional regulator